MPTQRYEHRLRLLPYSPAFRALRPDEQDALLCRLYAAFDLSDLSPEDRLFVRDAVMEIANGAAEHELPGSTGDFGRIDEAVDSEDEDLIERVLDSVDRKDQPLTPDEADLLVAECNQYSEERVRRLNYVRGEFVPGQGAIWHREPPLAYGPTPDDLQPGVDSFTVLLVLRVHPAGTIDVCRLADVPTSPEHVRATTKEVPPPFTYISQHVPTLVWLGVNPQQCNIHPHGNVGYPEAELRKLLARLHLR